MPLHWRKSNPTQTDNINKKHQIKHNKFKHTSDNDNNSQSDINKLSTHLPIYEFRMNDHDMPYLYDSIPESTDCVLLGESTHGTAEFYQLRSNITKYLILNRGFTAIFIELDWPKVYVINEYITGKLDSNVTIDSIFNNISEYPLWLYRNNIIRELIIWLKTYNNKLKTSNSNHSLINFYGIDMQTYKSLQILKLLYKKHSKILTNSSQIITFLNEISIQTIKNDIHWAYNQLQSIYKLFISSLPVTTTTTVDTAADHDDNLFELLHNIDQNFLNVIDAIKYFGNYCLWDIRDNHWFKCIDMYFYYKSYFQNPKQKHLKQKQNNRIILWAHNSHLYNSDYTDYSYSNIGSILAHKYGSSRVFSICCDTFNGSVTATKNRNQLAMFFRLNDNVNDSFSYLLHNKYNNNLILFLENGANKLKKKLINNKLKYSPQYWINIHKKYYYKIRDIGVCYINNDLYHHCSSANVFKIADILIFIDKTNALQPFQQDKGKNWDKNKGLYDALNN